MFVGALPWRSNPPAQEVECTSMRPAGSGWEPATPSSCTSSEGEPAGPSSSAGSKRDCFGVRARAAYFEALIRSNTTTLVRCSPGCSGSVQEVGSSGRLSVAGGDLNAEGFGAVCLAASCERGALECQEIELCGPPGPDDRDGASSACDAEDGAGDDDDDAYSEVTMTLRLPRRRREAVVADGAADDRIAARADELQARVSALESSLARKSVECDSLTRVVRELSEGRVKATAARAVLAEKHAELQAELHRMHRIAELSRAVSKENMTKTSKTQTQLRQAQQELHSTRRRAEGLEERNKKLRSENLALREKIGLLERYDFEHVQQSVCMRQYTRCRVAETY